MAYVYDNKTYRNLQQQVKENMDNIAELQDMKLVGIDVAGIVQDYSSLPSSAEQGKVYAVGTSSPYELYVYNNSSWVDFGEFPKAGPKGDQGPQGEPGRQGPRGLTGPQGPKGYTGAPGTPGRPGPQGDKGPKGDKGDPGWVDAFAKDAASVTTVGQAYVDSIGYLQVCTSLSPLTFEQGGYIKGPMGSRGIQGPQGEQGPKGDTGPQGPVGPQGPKGDQGELPEDVATKNYVDSHVADAKTYADQTIIKELEGYATKVYSNENRDSAKDYADKRIAEAKLAIISKNPTKTSQLTNDSDLVTSTELSSALANKQDTISDLETIRSGAEAGSTAIQPLTLSIELDTKQDVISDLADIRSGASKGATAVQPAALSEYAKTSELATVATSGNYNDLINKPIFTYKSDVIKDDYMVIKTIYGGSHVKFINADNPGSIHDHIIDLSLPILTWGTYGAFTEYAYNDSAMVEACYKCWKAYINEHNLQINDTINLKLTYTDSTGSTITSTGTGLIHSNSMIDPSALKHQIRLANVSFPDLNISNATFRIQPQYSQIYINCPQFSDSAGQLVTNIKISMDITEENVHTTIDSNFMGTDIARTADIPTTTGELTNDSGFITNSALSDYATTSAVSTAVSTAILSQTRETWTFTLSDGSTVTKTVVLG